MECRGWKTAKSTSATPLPAAQLLPSHFSIPLCLLSCSAWRGGRKWRKWREASVKCVMLAMSVRAGRRRKENDDDEAVHGMACHVPPCLDLPPFRCGICCCYATLPFHCLPPYHYLPAPLTFSFIEQYWVGLVDETDQFLLFQFFCFRTVCSGR
jgi:hypothetical protein